MVVIPKWNGIRIDQKLQRFLTIKSDITGFESFYNLHRNSKYRNLEIDWNLTFLALQSDSSTTKTNFASSNRKALKVRFLIEEILTIEQLKKSFYDIYKDWKCQICGIENEDFDHVWLCSENRLILQSIMEESIFYLMEQLLIDNENFKDDNDLAEFHDFWNISRYDPNSFTFIDLIKGIIPLLLSQKLKNLQKKVVQRKL